MSIVNTKILLQDARKHGYAIGAFNVENMEMMQAVVSAAELENVPIILQTTPSTIRYASPAVYAAMAKALGESAKVPVAIHLDHGSSYKLCETAATCGYTSLMIDGSKLPYEENISLAKSVVELARKFNCSVEAELGCLGGKEDDLEVKAGEDLLTNPNQAYDYITRSGIDSLAVAIGSAHGFYEGTPKLDFVRLNKINELSPVPLVLHGSSGIPDDDIKEAISFGICKVNFATELRVTYTNAVRATLAEDETIYDPKIFGTHGRESLIEHVRHRIRVCSGK